MTTPEPISQSATQRASSRTADGQTDRRGGEDRDRWRRGLERWSDRATEEGSDGGGQTLCPAEERSSGQILQEGHGFCTKYIIIRHTSFTSEAPFLLHHLRTSLYSSLIPAVVRWQLSA